MTTHDDALREAEARLGSAVAYVEYRATADVEGLDEIIDAAIEVGRLRERAEERRNLMTESDALREARARLWQAREDADDVVYRGDMSPEEVCEYQDRREAAAIEVGRLQALAHVS